MSDWAEPTSFLIGQKSLDFQLSDKWLLFWTLLSVPDFDHSTYTKVIRSLVYLLAIPKLPTISKEVQIKSSQFMTGD